MTEQEKAEKDIEGIMIDVIDQLKETQGKTKKDVLKITSIIEVLKIIGAYIQAIHLTRKEKEQADG